uniref:EGF-like domain-containing protein n=1 Tax=Steinernema glaseri TaxID=37863 RepID=A0A1I8AE53_9BILA
MISAGVAFLLALIIIMIVPSKQQWYCPWCSKEKEEPVKEEKTTTTTTTTTTTLPPFHCWKCSDASFCEDSAQTAEGEICRKCICPKGLKGDCCDEIDEDPCLGTNSTELCAFGLKCEFNLIYDFKCVCDEANGNCDGDPQAPGEVEDLCEKNPCLNKGNCTTTTHLDKDFNVIKELECKCDPQFGGKYCESLTYCLTNPCACATHKCENNATCSENPANYLADYTCACPEGFTGKYCEQELPCVLSNPCEHGGECEVDPRNPMEFTCRCASIWMGQLCERYDPCHTLKDYCVNGRCVPVDEKTGECSCTPGYNGTFCENDIDDCAPEPCMYGGICTDKVNNFTCECPLGTDGHRCEINFDDCGTGRGNETYCMSRDRDAVCVDGVNSYTCICSDEWVNENCTMRRIIWEVVSKFNNSEMDLVGLLEDLVSKPSLIQDIIPFFLALLPAENQTQISWDQEDMFEWASFEGQELDVKKDIVKWNAATLGNCFTFNHDSQQEHFPLRYAGEREGFRAMMRVRQDEYLDWVDTASLLVFVHSSTETVFGESLRFQAKPGAETSLMISQTTFERLGGKYGVCVEDKSEVKAYYYSGEYTTDGCLRSCYQDAVFEKCGCMDPRFPGKEGVTSCGLETRTCVMNVTEQRGDPSNWPDCHCPLPCSNGQFNVHWSLSDLPSKLADCSKYKADPVQFDSCSKNLTEQVLINVYFPQLIQNTFKEEPKMDFNKFVSTLGGLLGVLSGRWAAQELSGHYGRLARLAVRHECRYQIYVKNAVVTKDFFCSTHNNSGVRVPGKIEDVPKKHVRDVWIHLLDAKEESVAESMKIFDSCSKNLTEQVLINVYFPQLIQNTFKEEPKMDAMFPRADLHQSSHARQTESSSGITLWEKEGYSSLEGLQDSTNDNPELRCAAREVAQ